jgi:hypothetical protein
MRLCFLQTHNVDTTSFLTGMLFLSFSSLIALAETSNTVLSRMGILVLCLILEEKFSVFSHGLQC